MPQTRLCIITTSRNTLQELEIKSGGISNFFGVFSDLRLAFFNKEKDQELYWKWAEQNDIEASDEYKQEVLYYAGLHPFLIDLLNYKVFIEAVNENQRGNNIIEKASSSVRSELWSQYNKILAVMEEEKLSRALIQEIIGPAIDVKQEEIEKLMKYPDNLVRYTYPMEMWDMFIQSDWTYFQKILGGSISQWRERFSLLAKIRTPIAHSNKDFINPDDSERAKSICQLILDKTGAMAAQHS